MINILILVVFVAIFKIFILIAFGYYTFRHSDKPDCYAPEGSSRPTSKRIDETDTNVTREFDLVF